MNRHQERRVREALDEIDRAGSGVEPPDDLLAKLQDDIPAGVELHPSLRAGNVVPFRRLGGAPSQRRIWLAAASLVAMLGAGFLALRVRESAPGLERHAPADEAANDALSEPPAAADAVDEGVGTSADTGATDTGRLADRQAGSPSPSEVAAPAVQPVEIPEAAEVAKEAKGERIWVGTEGSVAGRAAAQEPEAAVRRRLAQAERRPASPKAVAPPAAAKPSTRKRDERQAESDLLAFGYIVGGVEGGVAGGVAGGVPGGVVGGVPAPAPPPPPPVPSTGGNAEPNDQPYGDVFFKTYGVNPFVDSDEDRLSTFGLDVDSGSFTVVRRYLEDGHLPPHEAVRLEEVVNFFDYGDPAPSVGDFSIRIEGAPNPFGASPLHRVLRIGLKAREVDAERRKPAQLTFVVDVSGSMAQEDRILLVKRALGLLVDQLRGDDRVGIVVFGSTARVLLKPTGDKGAIREAIEALRTEGATNAEAGLTVAYDLARANFRPGASNRLILCSDGVANVGATGPESILERIGVEARRGLELSTIGFGMGNYNDVLMEQLADRGDGRYAYVDTLEEARRIFVEGLSGTLQTIAKDAKVQVEFAPAVVQSWRLLGYENRDVADDRFRDDSVDAGDVGAGHAVTALYEIKLRPNAAGIDRRTAATVRLRWLSKESGKVVEVARSIDLGDFARRWESASPALRLASLAGQFAEILRGSYWARGESAGDVARRAQALVDDLPERLRGQAIDLATLALRAARLAPVDGKE